MRLEMPVRQTQARQKRTFLTVALVSKEREASTGGDSTGDEGEDLLSELDELERERRVVRSVGRKEGEEQAQVT
jgi:hypothetical protein